MKSTFFNILLLFSCLVCGCTQAPDTAFFQPSPRLPDYKQSTFSSYIEETRQWVAQNRAFLTDDKQIELDANTPFELKPNTSEDSQKGILLVHGLSDSPYFFTDIAKVLKAQGFLVRSMLMPGHGSRPADLMLPSFSDWQAAVQHQITLLAQDVDELWLGGFSTGANLVTSLAIQNEAIAGLLLFSPGFEPRTFLTALAPYANWFLDWVDIDPPGQNYTRYSSLPLNGVSLYYQSSQDVLSQLATKPFTRPVLITISEDDSVINPIGVANLFHTRFTHPQSRLIWFGQAPGIEDTRMSLLPQSLPELKISNFSHMSVLFAPENPFYGKSGRYRTCNNGQTEAAEAQCPTASDIWYSKYGYQEPGKIHARLTWNPYFKQLADHIKLLLAVNDH